MERKSMDYKKLVALRDELNLLIAANPEAFLSFEKSFEVSFAHESTALEGNTLTLIETKLVIEDGISIGGKPLREVYEVKNHANAFSYVKECVMAGKPLCEADVKEIHSRLMEGIIIGGIYRDTGVRITGARHKPPVPSVMYVQIKDFFADLPQKSLEMNAIEFAAFAHAEFVKIHPFIDGNGRTSRLIMNRVLIENKFQPVLIRTENRKAYIEALESYAMDGDLTPFSEMIAELEEAYLRECIEEFSDKNKHTEQ
jgi:Fic family protein